MPDYVDDFDKVGQMDAEYQPEIIEPWMVIVPDDDETQIAGVRNEINERKEENEDLER